MLPLPSCPFWQQLGLGQVRVDSLLRFIMFVARKRAGNRGGIMCCRAPGGIQQHFPEEAPKDNRLKARVQELKRQITANSDQSSLELAGLDKQARIVASFTGKVLRVDVRRAEAASRPETSGRLFVTDHNEGTYSFHDD